MMAIVWTWAALTSVFVVAAAALPTVKVRSWGVAIAAAAVFGVANTLLGWLLTFLTKALLFLPTILTLGLAGLLVPVIVNMVLLKITDASIGEEFEIEGVGALASLSVAVSVTGMVVGQFLG